MRVAVAGRAAQRPASSVLVPKHGRVSPVIAAPVRRARVIAAATATQDPQVAKLTELVLEAEGQLAALFEPGQPMPKAGVVAGLREKVADLKTKLAQLMAGADVATVLGGESLSPEMNAAERTRQAFAEIERTVDIKYQRSKARVDDSAAIAVLEAENERLRYDAHALLLRQQQLEDLLGEGARTEFSTATASAVASAWTEASVLKEFQRGVR